MLFVVIERFRDNDIVPVYQHLHQQGRSLPGGLEYVDSWVAADFSRCFQLMRSDDLRLIQAWILEWRGSGMTFEIVPVVTSAEARGGYRAASRTPGGPPQETRRDKLITSHFACIHGRPLRCAANSGGNSADVYFAL
jgi:Protein of unknown function (DUF3303)